MKAAPPFGLTFSKITTSIYQKKKNFPKVCSIFPNLFLVISAVLIGRRWAISRLLTLPGQTKEKRGGNGRKVSGRF